MRCALDLEPEALVVAVLAHGGADVAAQAARLAGVTKVVLVDAPHNAAPLAAVLAPQVASARRRLHARARPVTTFGKDLLPRVAALLGVGQVSDVLAVSSPHRFAGPIYAGNAIVTVDADPQRLVVATVRARVVPRRRQQAAGARSSKRTLDVALPATRASSRGARAAATRPDLQTAQRVVSGGRALGSAEGFKLVAELADKLGAALGASRAAVDAGFVAERSAGRPDRQDHRAGALRRRRHLAARSST